MYLTKLKNNRKVDKCLLKSLAEATCFIANVFSRKFFLKVKQSEARINCILISEFQFMKVGKNKSKELRKIETLIYSKLISEGVIQKVSQHYGLSQAHYVKAASCSNILGSKSMRVKVILANVIPHKFYSRLDHYKSLPKTQVLIKTPKEEVLCYEQKKFQKVSSLQNKQQPQKQLYIKERVGKSLNKLSPISGSGLGRSNSGTIFNKSEFKQSAIQLRKEQMCSRAKINSLSFPCKQKKLMVEQSNQSRKRSIDQKQRRERECYLKLSEPITGWNALSQFDFDY